MPVQNSRMSSLQNDTVSFRGNFLQDAYNNLNATINTRILPFVQDSKQTYQALIDINNDAVSIFDKISKQEIDLISVKADYLNPDVNIKLKRYQPLIERYDKYCTNLKSYARIKSIVKDGSYNTEEMKEALKNTENILFHNNPGLNKLKPLAQRYEDAISNIYLYNDKRTLKFSDLPLKDKLFELENNRSQAAAFIISIPLPETAMMLRSFKNAAKEVEKPTQSLMKTLTTLEHLQQTSESIIKDIDRYYKNNDKISDFIENYNNDTNNKISDKEILSAYNHIKQSCERNVDKEIKSLEIFYETQYLDKNVKIDFKSLDSYLNDCESSVEQLYKMKKQIDQEIIEQNSKEFWNKFGSDPLVF